MISLAAGLFFILGLPGIGDFRSTEFAMQLVMT